MWKCPKCNHLDEGPESHECPTPEYLEARRKLVSAAAQALEMCSEDELEEYARKNKESENDD